MAISEGNNIAKFKSLFDGFRSVQSESLSPSSTNAERFKRFLTQFSSLHEREVDEAHDLAPQFRFLFTQYAAKRSQSNLLVSAKADKFTAFAKGFEQARRHSTHQAEELARSRRERFASLLSEHSKGLRLWETGQYRTAERFNIFEVIDLTYDELSHSRMLTWLLDRNYRKYGTHAQGNLGFRLFLSELGLPLDLAECPYWVRREVPGKKSRIDIEVAARGKFFIHIEVKIRSPEGHEETAREWDDLRARAAEFGVDECRKHALTALYLTASGARAGHNRFQSITWKQIGRVLRQFARDAQPPDVRLFASHYARTLDSFIVDSDEQESEEPNA